MARGDHMVLVNQSGAQFKARLPEGLHSKIKASASANNRSSNAEIVSRLEASFDAPRAVAPEIARIFDECVQREVEARLLAMARNLGGSNA